MKVSNVVLDRDKMVVTFDGEFEKGFTRAAVWEDETGWMVIVGLRYSIELNDLLGGVELNGLSLENLSMRAEGKPDQVTTFTIPEYYNNQYKGLKIDPYRICKIYHIEHPCHQHAIKKLLRGLNKGDIGSNTELIESVEGILARWKEMIKEDAE